MFVMVRQERTRTVRMRRPWTPNGVGPKLPVVAMVLLHLTNVLPVTCICVHRLLVSGNGDQG